MGRLVVADQSCHGGLLDRLGGLFGPCWKLFKPSGGPLGIVLGRLGALLGESWVISGSSWADLGLS